MPKQTRIGTKVKPSAVEAFIALSDAEKDAIVAKYDAGPIPESELTEMTSAERRRWERFQAGLRATHAAKAAARVGPAKRKARQPARGVAVRSIRATLDEALVAEADAFVKAQGMRRTELIAVGLRLAMTRNG